MQKIAGIPREEFLQVAEKVMARFITLPENPRPERTGGFMAVLEKVGPKILLVNELGLCLPETSGRCFEYCQEKVLRLYNNLSLGHISGWQSRDCDNKKYGGAIVAPRNSMGVGNGQKIIGAVSGLVEHGDEAVALVIWATFRWITLREAEEIIKISSNTLFMPLLQKCNDLADRTIRLD